ncbi:ATP-binding protein [Thiovibrio sp. JS02]
MTEAKNTDNPREKVLARELAEARESRDYYRRIAREAGRKRLQEIDQLNRVISKFKEAEHSLTEAQKNLEERVTARTRELRESNERLRREITERESATTALRENEERLRLALKGANQGIYDLDLRSGKAVVTPEYALMLGFAPDAFEETNEKWLKRLHPDDLERVRSCYEGYLRGETSEYRVEFRQRTATGAWRWILSLGEIMERDALGKPTRMLGTHTDITARKLAELEIIRAKKIESIGTLAGGIAHDFNNLLSVILGNIELGRTLLQGRERELSWLEDAHTASIKAKELIRKFISFSTKSLTRREISELPPIIEDAASLALSGTNVQLTTAFARQLWPIEIDKSQIREAAFNVIKNAVEAMPHGGIVAISAENTIIDPVSRNSEDPARDGEYVKIVFHDSGPGIPEKDLSNIFDPYFSTKERGAEKGMGFGLSIAYSILKNHAGHIEITSSPGKGTEVIFYLPKAAPPAPATVPAPAGMTRLGKILIMDDEELVRNMLRKMLEHLGYTVVEAGNGEEALALYRKSRAGKKPCLAAILDLTIKGGMGGLDTLNALRGLDPGVRAIVASGHSSDLAIDDFAAYGFKAALRKPFTITLLQATLEEVLGRGTH